MKKQKVWKTLAAWAGQLVLSLLALVGAVRLAGGVGSGRAKAGRRAANGRKGGHAVADKEKAKKQVPLRLSASLYAELARWAEDEVRSVNGQIEYLLTEAVRQRRKSKPKDE